MKSIDEWGASTDQAQLQLLSLQRFDSGVRSHAPADQHTLPQMIPEHGRQLLMVAW